MRHHLVRIIGLGSVLAIALSIEPRFAEAQIFPGAGGATAVWLPLTRNGANVTDGVNATPDARDIVGDAANPAAYVASDANHLFLRVRVNGSPTVGPGFAGQGWGCIIETNTSLTSYEFIAMVDGNGGDTVRYAWNSTPGNNTTADNAETNVTTFSTSTHASSSTAGTSFSGNADYFVNLAIPWTTVRNPGGGAPAVPAGTPMRFICGTSESNPAMSIAKDAASSEAENAPVTLTGSWSDAYVCNFGGNTSCTSFIDTDGDGVPNATETSLGTDPNVRDTDGDGIRDDIELTPAGGGAFAAVDTDGDGQMDALDADSDNDCVTDLSEGAGTFRNAALPNADPNVVCVAPNARFCSPTTGTCVGCNGSFGSGSTFACSSSTTPGCNSSGPLVGQCTQCTATVLTQCTVGTPTCNSATGTCAACNGNNGSGATQACPTTTSPACYAGGVLNGRCTQCKPDLLGQCTPDKPACSTSSGNCAPCNGHFGFGSSAPCPTEAQRACHPSGPLVGRCTQCSATNVTACNGTSPYCDLTTGLCAPCGGDFGSGAPNACATAAAPGCNTTGPLTGTCTPCAPGPTTAACPAATPTCSTTAGTCTACTGHNGSGAVSACPDTAAPSCNPLGAPLAGRCTICSSNNTNRCTASAPACDLATGTCAPCNGDRGSGATQACPSVDAPYCNLTDGPNGAAGTCGKCTGPGQCGGNAHAGPTCDVTTGACFDTDSDGDGLNDSLEIRFGTDPSKKDSDGDGLEDLLEVTPIGGGATKKVDSDADGTIDALDSDSDNDGLLDKDEGLVDTDGDGAEDYRDADDDNDKIFTKDEVADTASAKVALDLDGDGKKNWLDDDADGDGLVDGQEGRADNDGDGRPNYLDTVNDPPGVPDAGPGNASSGSSGQADAGIGDVAAIDDGVLEGSGFLCSGSPGRWGGTSGAIALGAIALSLASRRLRRRR